MHQPGTNIRNLRRMVNMTQTQLAKAAEVDQSVLSNLERGTGGYSAEGIARIAAALGVSVGVLFEDGMTVDAAALGARRVPVIKEEEVADWKGMESSNFDWDKQEFLFAGLANASRYAFALRVRDALNAPVFDIGDDILFDPKVQPWPGAMVVATDKNGKAHVGRLRQLPHLPSGHPAFEVVPANMFHPATSSVEGLTLKGVMVEHRKYARR